MKLYEIATYQTYEEWRRAVKKFGGVIDGDRDIASARKWDGHDGFTYYAKWDGHDGFTYYAKWDGAAGEIERVANKPSHNPVPPSSRAGKSRATRDDADKARLLYEKFTGHDGNDEVVIDKPVMPDVMCVIGDIDGIMYTTVRDGKTEKYLHKFKKSARPLFCVSPDGLSLYLIGGSYQFGERGIVDK